MKNIKKSELRILRQLADNMLIEGKGKASVTGGKAEFLIIFMVLLSRRISKVCLILVWRYVYM